MKALILLIAIFSWFGENENLRKAKQLIAIEKYTQAIVILQPMEDIRAQYYLGWCYLKINRCSDANTHFDRFISEYSENDLWIEEAKKNKLSCNGPTYAVATNPDNGKDLKVKYDYKKLNDDYQIAMASYQKKDTVIEFNPVDLASLTPITNFKRVKNKNNQQDENLGFQKLTPSVVKDKHNPEITTNKDKGENDPMKEHLTNKEKGENDPMTEHLTNKEKGENDPMTEHLTNKEKGENGPMTEHLTNKDKGENDPMTEHLTNKEKGENDPMTEHLTNKDKGENDPMTEHLTNKDKGENDPMTEHLTNKDKGENDPMTEHLTNKDKGENDPMTEHLTNKTDNPESFDITSAATHHHYKILFTIDNQPEKAFLSLASIGPVTYEKVNGNNYMYYIGFYPSEDQANAARDKVKAAGYKMARVMEFNKGLLEKEHITDIEQPSVTDVLDKKINKEPVPSQPAQEVPKVTPAPEVPKKEIAEIVKIQEIIKSDVISYHILFRVLDNPNEQFDDLKKFGPLYRETFDAKGNSRYLIGNTDDINVAKQLLEKVKKAGYPASFISEYINGSLSKIIQE